MIPRRLARNIIYESEWVSLYVDKIQFEDNRILDKMHLVHYDKEAVAIVVLNDKDEVLLIKSDRYHTQSVEWEIPAGGVDENEKPHDAAVREAFEETGYTVENPKFIYRYNPSNGSSDQVVNIYSARAGVKTGEPDPQEVSETKWVSKHEIKEMLRKNEINCGLSLIGLMLVFFVGLNGD